MSYEDDPRSRERGAYTPPTDDDLPFRRGGGYDARGPRRTGGGSGGPPVTLIVSAIVLLLLIVAVVVFYRAGARSPDQAPPIVGQEVGALKVEAPIEAQPVDPEAGIRVYREGDPAADAPPTYVPPPEAPLPRPTAPVEAAPLPPAARATPAPDPAAPAVPAEKAAPPPAAGGSSGVQIGAFSSTAVADREYAAVAARFPQFAQGAGKRVQEVTASNGATVYRTTFTGMSRERATAFCSALRAAGRDCIVR